MNGLGKVFKGCSAEEKALMFFTQSCSIICLDINCNIFYSYLRGPCMHQVPKRKCGVRMFSDSWCCALVIAQYATAELASGNLTNLALCPKLD